MADLELNLFGGVEGTLADGRPLDLPTRKSWALLAYLALQPGRPIGRDHLATLLWSDRFDEQARRSLRQTIYEVRKALGDGANGLLTAERDTVTLRGEGLSVDVARFEELAASDDAEALAEVEGLYRGPLLEGLEASAPGFEGWLTAERSRLQDMACGVLERLAARHLEQGAHETAIETARRLIRLDPLRELAHRLLMRALAAASRRSEALRHYQELEALLQAELSVEPDAETLRLRNELLRDVAPTRSETQDAASGPTRDQQSMETRVSVRLGPSKPWRRLAAAAVATIALAAAGAWYFYPRSSAPVAEVAPDANYEIAPQDRPSIAVLPFENLSDDPIQNHFADGLTEDLITALAKVPHLFVIARNSTAAYKGKPVKMQEVAGALGVRYVVEGSVQKSGEDLRVTAQLIDTASGYHLWAENYDRPAREIFALQDEIIRQILIGLQVKLTAGDNARIASRGTRNLEAWLLRVQGRAVGFTFTREGILRARELFQAAHKADPNWARPLAGIAWTYWEESKRGGWTTTPGDALRRGIALAERAIELDPEGPLGYMQLGNLMILKGEVERGIALREKAVAIAPNDFLALVGLAYQLIWNGEEDRALALYDQAKRVSPLYPWWVLYAEGLALHMTGRHADAIDTLTLSVERNPRMPAIHARLAAVYAELGRMEEARAETARLLEKDPATTLDIVMGWHHFRDAGRTSWYRGLLKTAGVPD